ncbi:hypothetical protein DPSP01_005473 [Paraphaeosphaeria sporulosa]
MCRGEGPNGTAGSSCGETSPQIDNFQEAGPELPLPCDFQREMRNDLAHLHQAAAPLPPAVPSLSNASPNGVEPQPVRPPLLQTWEDLRHVVACSLVLEETHASHFGGLFE